MPRPLPLDLLPQIVEEAAGPSSKLDYATLSALCLTSKDFLSLARAALYRRVVTSFGSGVDNDGEEQCPFLWLDDLGLTLLNHSHLAGRVVRLEVQLEEVGRTAEHSVPEAVVNLLKCCHNLQMLKLDSTCHNPYTMDHLPGALIEVGLFANLTKLSAVHTGPNALRLLHQCINLRQLDLRLGYTMLGDSDPLGRSPFASFPFRLERFSMKDDISLPLFRAITLNSTNSLHILHLDSEDLLRLAEPIAELASLDELCITYQRRNGQYPPAYIPELSSVLHTINSLRTLTIQALRQSPVPRSLLSLLPPTITNLYLSRVYITDALLLLTSDVGRRLSELAVVDFSWSRSDLAEEEARRLLEEAADKAGVKLVKYGRDRFGYR